MKKILALFLATFASQAAFAQADPGVNINATPSTFNVGATTTFQVDISNGGNLDISQGCLVVTVSIPSGVATITGLGPGSNSAWTSTILDGGATIRLVNANGAFPAFSALQTVFVTATGAAASGGALNVSANISYSLSGGCSAAGNLSTTNDNSSTSITVNEAPTPVTIASFTAKAVGTNAQLDWVTSSERNNAFFDIQHSTDLKVFESVGKIAGKGTTSARNTYTFTHFNPDPAVIHYYRLRQVDNDGTYADQPVKSVQFDSYVGIALKAHADPGRNVRVFVDYGDDNLSSAATVSLLDVTGQKVGTRSIQLVKGRNTVDFASGSLASGVYLVRLENPSKNTSVRIVLP